MDNSQEMVVTLIKDMTIERLDNLEAKLEPRGNPASHGRQPRNGGDTHQRHDHRTPLSSFSLRACVNNAVAICLVDTGAAVPLISHCLLEKLLETNTKLTLEYSSRGLVGVQGAPLKLLGEYKVQWSFEGLDRTIVIPVQIADIVTSDAILGRDFLQDNRCAVKMGPINQLQFTQAGRYCPVKH